GRRFMSSKHGRQIRGLAGGRAPDAREPRYFSSGGACMTTNPSAGQPADPAQLVDVEGLTQAYYSTRPDPGVVGQRIAFGTSGHRGSALHAAFNEDHILAVVEATCRYRQRAGTD